MSKGIGKKILYIAIALLLGVGFFYMYSSRSSSDDDALIETSTAATAGSVEVMRLLTELQNVSFNREVLSSPVLQELSDWSVTLTPETPGRPNPFAPIGVDVAPATADEPESSE